MIGIDIVQISRIAEKIKNNSFMIGCFTVNERAYYVDKGTRSETLAGFFAAKEAVAKALGTGIAHFKLTDIEVTHTPSGAPQITLYHNAKRIADQKGAKEIHISIAHDGDMATAIAMLQH